MRSLESIIDLSEDVAKQAQEVFLLAEPYPHVVLDGLWRDDFLRAVAGEIPTIQRWSGEKNFSGSVQKKWLSEWEHMPLNVSRLLTYLNGDSFLELLSKITGVDQLKSDPYLEGGGVHSTGNGGFLNLHTDFNWNTNLQLLRKLNVLVYVNEDWRDEYRGDLLLAKKQRDAAPEIIKRIAPVFNRTVIFITDANSVHGHPEPLSLPVGKRRDSLATYYYVSSANDTQASMQKKRTDTTYY